MQMMTSWVKKADVLIEEMCRSAAYSSFSDIRSNTAVSCRGSFQREVLQYWSKTNLPLECLFSRDFLVSASSLSFHAGIFSCGLPYSRLQIQSRPTVSFSTRQSPSGFHFFDEEQCLFFMHLAYQVWFID